MDAMDAMRDTNFVRQNPISRTYSPSQVSSYLPVLLR